jgi:thioredoxin reductase (NADPH)
VQNWPGELEISGHELAEKVRQQAIANGAKIEAAEVVRVDFSRRPFLLTLRSVDTGAERQIAADACIVATGTRSNYLNIPGEQALWGRGVSNCATCDGSLYKGKVVGVVGGGDAAIIEGLYLAPLVKELHLFVRKGEFRAVEKKRLASLLTLPNVKVHYHTTVAEVLGSQQVTGVKVKKGETLSTIPLDGLFLAIGSKPNSEIFRGQLDTDSSGYIRLAKDQETSVPGVYATGDVADPHYKQAISAAGDGAKAALQAHRFIADQRSSAAAIRKEPPPRPKKKEASSVIEIVSQDHFFAELNGSEMPVIVDFYATWCGPCRRISPLLEETALNLEGKVKVLKVNVDLLSALAGHYEIQSMPTLIMIEPNGDTQRKVGTQEISDFLKDLNPAK